MEDKIDNLRDLLYKKIESKEDEEIIKASQKLDLAILEYYGEMKKKA